MNIIGTRETFDGIRYLLVEERSGNLSICDGRGVVPTRNHLSARAWLAVWAELSVLDDAEIPGAMRRASTADKAGKNIREAIHAPAVRAEAERHLAARRPSFVLGFRDGVILTSRCR